MMTPRRQKYSLPDGKLTTSIAKYQRAWRSAARRVEHVFQGYSLVAYDPGFLFSDGGDQFVLSWRAVQALTRTMVLSYRVEGY